jgi:hypothetical protein
MDHFYSTSLRLQPPHLGVFLKAQAYLYVPRNEGHT